MSAAIDPDQVLREIDKMNLDRDEKDGSLVMPQLKPEFELCPEEWSGGEYDSGGGIERQEEIEQEFADRGTLLVKAYLAILKLQRDLDLSNTRISNALHLINEVDNQSSQKDAVDADKPDTVVGNKRKRVKRQ